MRKGLIVSLFALLLTVVPLVGVAANAYQGAVFVPNDDGTYTIITPSGNQITLDKVGKGKLLFTFNKDVNNGKVTVKESQERPAAASSNPSGDVYGYFEVTLDENITNDDVQSAVWTFTVEKSWLEQNGKTAVNVFLQHFNGEAWERLNTRQVSETDTEITFEADVDSFSPFAVTAVEGLSNTGSPYMVGAVIASTILAVLGGTVILSRKQRA